MLRPIVSRLNETTALGAFLICTILIGLVLIRSVPPFAGFDEAYHWFRALQISRGVPFAPRLGPNDWGGAIDLHGIKYAYWVAESVSGGKPIDRTSAAAESDALAATPPEHGTISFPSSATFAPTAYLPAAIAVYVARNMHAPPLAQVTAGRITQLMTYTSLLLAVVLVLPRGRLPVLAILTMPTALHLATSFSADPINVGLLALLVASSLRLNASLATRLGKMRGAALLGLSFLLGTLKLTYVPAVLFLSLIPVHLFSNRGAKWQFVAAGMALCCVTASIWAAIYHFIPGPYWHAGGDPAAALAFVKSHPIDTLSGMFHTIYDNLAFYWRDLSIRFGGGPAPYHFWAPSPFAWIELGLIAATSLLSGDRRPYPRITGLCALVAGLILGLLLLSFRLTYGPPGMRLVQGLQGRYFIPLVLLAALGIVYASPLSSPKGRMAGFGLLLCNHLAVCAYAVMQYRALWL